MKTLLLTLLVILTSCSGPEVQEEPMDLGKDRFSDEWTNQAWWPEFYSAMKACEMGYEKECTKSGDILVANGHYDRGGEGYRRGCVLGDNQGCMKLKKVLPIVQNQVNNEHREREIAVEQSTQRAIDKYGSVEAAKERLRYLEMIDAQEKLKEQQQ